MYSFPKIGLLSWAIWFARGLSLVPSSKPSQSVVLPEYVRYSLLKCILGLYSMLAETLISFLVGISFVMISTTPPVKSAGKSARADLVIWIFDNIFVGNRSICTVFLSGSRPGMSTPLSIDLEYRSPSPRTYTYFPPCTETPGTRLIALAMVEAPTFLKD